MDPLDGFPRQLARTRGFTLGVPRAFRVSPDGARIAFLRTRAGDDPVSCLWVFDVEGARERLVFDPRSIGEEKGLTPAELARRERARERSSGVTAYATDREVRRAAFAVSGRLFLADLVEASARELPVPGPPDDPRPDPTGRRVAYVVEGALHVLEIDGTNRVLAADEDPDTFWGLAEFNAAEELGRLRGHWWSPDGERLAATHVDQREVLVWHISDPTDPATEPRRVRYPAAGTTNAEVSLHVFDVGTGERVEVVWDRAAFPYLARVRWREGGPLTLLVLSRDQRRAQLLEADERTGRVQLLREDADPHWLDLHEGVPARLADGRVVSVVADREADTNRLTVDGESVTPPGLQVRGVLHAAASVLYQASQPGDPTEIHVWRWTEGEGSVRITAEPGVHAGTEGGNVLLLVSATMDAPLSTATVTRGVSHVGAIPNLAETPVVDPRPRFLSLGERELRAALFLPGGREPERPLPVLMDPYGGPHGARVLKAAGAHLTSQWLADHGFAVLVVDGRGVDGRGPAWDREMYRDFTVALEDQVDALHAAADRLGFLDLTRVGIRGWSFGGYLAALAVLRRPDVFHAAVAGAPVTDWRRYDTGYTERYLGHPDEEPEVYDRCSILADAARLERPLLLIHGLVDDNVVVAHTLRLSAALFEAGRPHELVVLPNLTHLSRAEAVTEHVLRVQLDFLRRTLVP